MRAPLTHQSGPKILIIYRIVISITIFWLEIIQLMITTRSCLMMINDLASTVIGHIGRVNYLWLCNLHISAILITCSFNSISPSFSPRSMLFARRSHVLSLRLTSMSNRSFEWTPQLGSLASAQREDRFLLKGENQ